MADALLGSGYFAFIVLPILIFCARICDVSLGTMRVIFIAKGIKYLAPVIGFFEVIVWLLAIGQVMNNLTNVTAYIAYGAGFAAGTYAGIVIEEKISLGLAVVRTITKEDPADLIRFLRSSDYGVTSVDGEGVSGPVRIIFTIVKRQDLPDVIGIIKRFHPDAFYSVEEVKSVSEGIFPKRHSRGFLSYFDFLRFARK